MKEYISKFRTRPEAYNHLHSAAKLLKSTGKIKDGYSVDVERKGSAWWIILIKPDK